MTTPPFGHPSLVKEGKIVGFGAIAHCDNIIP